MGYKRLLEFVVCISGSFALYMNMYAKFDLEIEDYADPSSARPRSAVLESVCH